MNLNSSSVNQGHSRKISTSSTSSIMKKRPHTPTISSATAQLLTSTKTLLKSLTAWASRTASVADVSGKFVKVGDDFKSLKKSYALQGLDVSDIKDIPTMLRKVLEESLILEPSQKTLDLFLPKVGQIVSELMKILKEKQAEAQRLIDQRKRDEPSSSRSASNPLISNISLMSANPNVLSTSTPDNSNVLPTPKALKDPIAKLQSNQSLMRRGSKRFSAYQTSKILSMHVANNPLPHEKMIPEFTSSNSSPSIGPLSSSSVAPTDSPASNISRPVDEITDSPLQAEVAKNIKQSEVHQQLVSPSNSLRPIDSSNGDVPPVSITPTISQNNKSKIFLKLGTQVKKVDIKLPTSMANVKVLFTQKFEYTPEGDIYPKVYAQEGVNGVAYELEDIADIQPGFILSLHEEGLKELENNNSTKIIQEQMEEQLNDIKTEISKISESLNMKIDKLSDVAKSSPSTPTDTIGPNSGNRANSITRSELQTLRLQLSKARQQQSITSKKLSSDMNTAISLVQKFQEIGLSPQGVISDPYMENCKSKVSNETETLVTKIDDLQDVIEALKLDLSKRGARPSHKQITYVGKEMSESKSSLTRLTSYMGNERKNWNSRWQAELTAILDEQEFFKEQETIIGLLEEDLQGADETYELIVKCVDEMEKLHSGSSTGGPNDMIPGNLKASLSLPLPDPSMSASDVRNALLTEVQLVQPNHESRIEAILKAEKLREKEKELLNSDDFQEELGDFVGHEKLKKSGGVEEIERKRKLQDEQNLKNTFGIV